MKATNGVKGGHTQNVQKYKDEYSVKQPKAYGKIGGLSDTGDQYEIPNRTEGRLDNTENQKSLLVTVFETTETRLDTSISVSFNYCIQTSPIVTVSGEALKVTICANVSPQCWNLE